MLLTTAESQFHFGGLELPLVVDILAMIFAGIVATIIGLICIRLRADYLAIATIGIAEIIKLILKNETKLPMVLGVSIKYQELGNILPKKDFTPTFQ